jgi:hypothetical protein
VLGWIAVESTVVAMLGFFAGLMHTTSSSLQFGSSAAFASCPRSRRCSGWDGLIRAHVRQSVGRALGMTVVAIGGAGAER